ncbi:MAG: ATP-binding protein [Bacilli bacterium]
MYKNEIMSLINLQQEGSYWDFKREWYSSDKKADLLHDIICMANNLANRDAYIIIGINEDADYCVSSVVDDPNRRNTQQLVDFLREKSFAGGVRPIVNVQSIKVEDAVIDIINIKNSFNTPFYLITNYQSVMPSNIYTRIMDSNTPKNKSADISQVELLWKKRLGLLSTPLERMYLFLQNQSEWDESPTDWLTSKRYYRYAPEFVIEYTLDDNGGAYQYYLFNQTDIRPHWREIRLYYHQTLLASMEGVCLDGGRYFSPTPLTDGISLSEYHNWDIVFKYFIKDTLKYTIHEFYYKHDGDEETYSHNRFLECLLVFNSEMEKENFKAFVIANWNKKEEYSNNIHLPYFENIEGYKMDVLKEEYLNVQILKNMFNHFIINK